MVALSFKEMFVDPIRVGLGLDTFLEVIGKVEPKNQTIRANGKRRPPRPGELLQLYCAMRTKRCRKIGDARCTKVEPIGLEFTSPSPQKRAGWRVRISINGLWLRRSVAERFARADGFASLDAFIAFWIDVHGAPARWTGNVIYWERLGGKAAG